MNIERWDFSLTGNDQRLVNLQNPPSFEEMAERINEEMDILCCHTDLCRDFWGFERVVFYIKIAKDLFDIFFNSKNGYRAHYYRSPFEGIRANHVFINMLLSKLCASNLTNNCILKSDLKESLSSYSSKIWLAECGKELKLNCEGCKGEWQASQATDSPEITNNRWETSSAEKAKWGRSAPYLTKLRITGAFLDNTGNEFIPSRKRYRSKTIHDYGWS
jgi:hypothetical protein